MSDNNLANRRLVRIDTAEARQRSGVHAVTTDADVRAGLWGRAVNNASAIANAVADAIGVRVRSLPLTSEKVFRELQKRG